MTADDRLPVSIRSIAEVVLTSGIAAVFSTAYVIASARLLGPESYADLGACLSFVYFAGLALSPLTPTVSRLCAVAVAQNDAGAAAALRRQMMLAAGAAMMAIAVIGFVLVVPLARAFHLRSPLSLALAFAIVVLYTIISIDRGVIHGFLLFRVHNVNTVLETALRCGGAVVLLTLVRRTAVIALAGYASAIVVAELALVVTLRKLLRTTGHASIDWKAVRRLTVPIAILMAGVAAFQNTDMLVVKRYFPAADAGAYAAATTLARAISVLFVPLYVVVSPLLARLHAARQPIRGVTLRMTGAFAMLGGVAAAILSIAREPIVTLLYGPGFEAAVALLAPLAILAVITYTALMLAQALITTEEHRFLWGYAVLAIAQVIALITFHANFAQVFAVLYASQGATLLLVVIAFATSRKVRA